MDPPDLQHQIFTCDYATGQYQPESVPKCIYGSGYKLVKTTKVTRKTVRTFTHGGGGFLNWTWALEGGSMQRHWKSTLGKTWILGKNGGLMVLRIDP